MGYPSELFTKNGKIRIILIAVFYEPQIRKRICEMEKNENGYPRAGFGGNGNGGRENRGNGCFCTENSGGNVGGAQNGMNGMQNGMNGMQNGMNGMHGTHRHNYTCGGDGSCLDDMSPAYVYAPSQKFRMLYSAKDALAHGTLFEELYKPKGVYGRE